MPVFLLSILRPLAPYLAAAVLLLCGAMYVIILRHDLQAANQKNLVLAQQNAENLAAIEAYKAQQVKWNEALDALDAQTLTTTTATGQIVAKINAAAKGDDGPVAPVLSEALDSLRALQGAAP